MISTMRPGRGPITTTRSASSTASGMLCVMCSAVLRVLHPQALNVHRNLLARQRIERAERLVHQQHARSVHQRAADRHALPHAAGQFVWLLLLEPFKAGRLEQSARDRLVFGAVHLADVDLQHDVGQNVAPVEHDGFLEHDADVGLRPVDALAADRDRSRRIGRKPRDHLQDGGLAAAARTDDGDELRLPDIQIDVAAGFGPFGPTSLVGDTCSLIVAQPDIWAIASRSRGGGRIATSSAV